MTLEEDSQSGGDAGGFSMIDFSVPQRDKPMVHPAVDPPLCENCQKLELAFFDPNCPGCQDILTNPNTTIPEIFAILRQWTPQTQQSLEMLVREVLKRGAHVDDRDGLTDMTLLHYCCKAGANGIGDIDEACRMANLVISKGADVYIRCRWTNMTALHYATYFDVGPVILTLLKTTKGIDVDNPCSEFDHGTPLHIAAANLAYEATKILIQNGADITLKDDLGRNPADSPSSDVTFASVPSVTEDAMATTQARAAIALDEQKVTLAMGDAESKQQGLSGLDWKDGGIPTQKLSTGYISGSQDASEPEPSPGGATSKPAFAWSTAEKPHRTLGELAEECDERKYKFRDGAFFRDSTSRADMRDRSADISPDQIYKPQVHAQSPTERNQRQGETLWDSAVDSSNCESSSNGEKATTTLLSLALAVRLSPDGQESETGDFKHVARKKGSKARGHSKNSEDVSPFQGSPSSSRRSRGLADLLSLRSDEGSRPTTPGGTYCDSLPPEPSRRAPKLSSAAGGRSSSGDSFASESLPPTPDSPSIFDKVKSLLGDAERKEDVSRDDLNNSRRDTVTDSRSERHLPVEEETFTDKVFGFFSKQEPEKSAEKLSGHLVNVDSLRDVNNTNTNAGGDGIPANEEESIADKVFGFFSKQEKDEINDEQIKETNLAKTDSEDGNPQPTPDAPFSDKFFSLFSKQEHEEPAAGKVVDSPPKLEDENKPATEEESFGEKLFGFFNKQEEEIDKGKFSDINGTPSRTDLGEREIVVSEDESFGDKVFGFFKKEGDEKDKNSSKPNDITSKTVVDQEKIAVNEEESFGDKVFGFFNKQDAEKPENKPSEPISPNSEKEESVIEPSFGDKLFGLFNKQEEDKDKKRLVEVNSDNKDTTSEDLHNEKEAPEIKYPTEEVTFADKVFNLFSKEEPEDTDAGHRLGDPVSSEVETRPDHNQLADNNPDSPSIFGKMRMFFMEEEDDNKLVHQDSEAIIRSDARESASIPAHSCNHVDSASRDFPDNPAKNSNNSEADTNSPTVFDKMRLFFSPDDGADDDDEAGADDAAVDTPGLIKQSVGTGQVSSHNGGSDNISPSHTESIREQGDHTENTQQLSSGGFRNADIKTPAERPDHFTSEALAYTLVAEKTPSPSVLDKFRSFFTETITEDTDGETEEEENVLDSRGDLHTDIDDKDDRGTEKADTGNELEGEGGEEKSESPNVFGKMVQFFSPEFVNEELASSASRDQDKDIDQDIPQSDDANLLAQAGHETQDKPADTKSTEPGESPSIFTKFKTFFAPDSEESSTESSSDDTDSSVAESNKVHSAKLPEPTSDSKPLFSSKVLDSRPETMTNETKNRSDTKKSDEKEPSSEHPVNQTEIVPPPGDAPVNQTEIVLPSGDSPANQSEIVLPSGETVLVTQPEGDKARVLRPTWVQMREESDTETEEEEAESPDILDKIKFFFFPPEEKEKKKRMKLVGFFGGGGDGSQEESSSGDRGDPGTPTAGSNLASPGESAAESAESGEVLMVVKNPMYSWPSVDVATDTNRLEIRPPDVTDDTSGYNADVSECGTEYTENNGDDVFDVSDDDTKKVAYRGLKDKAHYEMTRTSSRPILHRQQSTSVLKQTDTDSTSVLKQTDTDSTSVLKQTDTDSTSVPKQTDTDSTCAPQLTDTDSADVPHQIEKPPDVHATPTPSYTEIREQENHDNHSARSTLSSAVVELEQVTDAVHVAPRRSDRGRGPPTRGRRPPWLRARHRLGSSSIQASSTPISTTPTSGSSSSVQTQESMEAAEAYSQGAGKSWSVHSYTPAAKLVNVVQAIMLTKHSEEGQENQTDKPEGSKHINSGDFNDEISLCDSSVDNNPSGIASQMEQLLPGEVVKAPGEEPHVPDEVVHSGYEMDHHTTYKSDTSELELQTSEVVAEVVAEEEREVDKYGEAGITADQIVDSQLFTLEQEDQTDYSLHSETGASVSVDENQELKSLDLSLSCRFDENNVSSDIEEHTSVERSAHDVSESQAEFSNDHKYTSPCDSLEEYDNSKEDPDMQDIDITADPELPCTNCSPSAAAGSYLLNRSSSVEGDPLDPSGNYHRNIEHEHDSPHREYDDDIVVQADKVVLNLYRSVDNLSSDSLDRDDPLSDLEREEPAERHGNTEHHGNMESDVESLVAPNADGGTDVEDIDAEILAIEQEIAAMVANDQNQVRDAAAEVATTDLVHPVESPELEEAVQDDDVTSSSDDDDDDDDDEDDDEEEEEDAADYRRSVTRVMRPYISRDLSSIEEDAESLISEEEIDAEIDRLRKLVEEIPIGPGYTRAISVDSLSDEEPREGEIACREIKNEKSEFFLPASHDGGNLCSKPGGADVVTSEESLTVVEEIEVETEMLRLDTEIRSMEYELQKLVSFDDVESSGSSSGADSPVTVKLHQSADNLLSMDQSADNLLSVDQSSDNLLSMDQSADNLLSMDDSEPNSDQSLTNNAAETFRDEDTEAVSLYPCAEANDFYSIEQNSSVEINEHRSVDVHIDTTSVVRDDGANNDDVNSSIDETDESCSSKPKSRAMGFLMSDSLEDISDITSTPRDNPRDDDDNAEDAVFNLLAENKITPGDNVSGVDGPPPLPRSTPPPYTKSRLYESLDLSELSTDENTGESIPWEGGATAAQEELALKAREIMASNQDLYLKPEKNIPESEALETKTSMLESPEEREAEAVTSDDPKPAGKAPQFGLTPWTLVHVSLTSDDEKCAEKSGGKSVHFSKPETEDATTRSSTRKAATGNAKQRRTTHTPGDNTGRRLRTTGKRFHSGDDTTNTGDDILLTAYCLHDGSLSDGGADTPCYQGDDALCAAACFESLSVPDAEESYPQADDDSVDVVACSEPLLLCAVDAAPAIADEGSRDPAKCMEPLLLHGYDDASVSADECSVDPAESIEPFLLCEAGDASVLANEGLDAFDACSDLFLLHAADNIDPQADEMSAAAAAESELLLLPPPLLPPPSISTSADPQQSLKSRLPGEEDEEPDMYAAVCGDLTNSRLTTIDESEESDKDVNLTIDESEEKDEITTIDDSIPIDATEEKDEITTIDATEENEGSMPIDEYLEKYDSMTFDESEAKDDSMTIDECVEKDENSSDESEEDKQSAITESEGSYDDLQNDKSRDNPTTMGESADKDDSVSTKTDARVETTESEHDDSTSDASEGNYDNLPIDEFEVKSNYSTVVESKETDDDSTIDEQNEQHTRGTSEDDHLNKEFVRPELTAFDHSLQTEDVSMFTEESSPDPFNILPQMRALGESFCESSEATYALVPSDCVGNDHIDRVPETQSEQDKGRNCRDPDSASVDEADGARFTETQNISCEEEEMREFETVSDSSSEHSSTEYSMGDISEILGDDSELLDVTDTIENANDDVDSGKEYFPSDVSIPDGSDTEGGTILVSAAEDAILDNQAVDSYPEHQATNTDFFARPQCGPQSNKDATTESSVVYAPDTTTESSTISSPDGQSVPEPKPTRPPLSAALTIAPSESNIKDPAASPSPELEAEAQLASDELKSSPHPASPVCDPPPSSSPAPLPRPGSLKAKAPVPAKLPPAKRPPFRPASARPPPPPPLKPAKSSVSRVAKALSAASAFMKVRRGTGKPQSPQTTDGVQVKLPPGRPAPPPTPSRPPPPTPTRPSLGKSRSKPAHPPTLTRQAATTSPGKTTERSRPSPTIIRPHATATPASGSASASAAPSPSIRPTKQATPLTAASKPPQPPPPNKPIPHPRLSKTGKSPSRPSKPPRLSSSTTAGKTKSSSTAAPTQSSTSSLSGQSPSTPVSQSEQSSVSPSTESSVSPSTIESSVSPSIESSVSPTIQPSLSSAEGQSDVELDRLYENLPDEVGCPLFSDPLIPEINDSQLASLPDEVGYCIFSSSLDSVDESISDGSSPQDPPPQSPTPVTVSPLLSPSAAVSDCVPDPSAFDPGSDMGQLVGKMKKTFEEAEPPGADPHSENLQGQVALQALGLKIGEKVLVAGVKSGILRYCGPTQFASGVWAGIELSEPAGKNDGSVGGTIYFKCSPKYGIFAPISKIGRPGSSRPSTASSIKQKISHGSVDTSHVTAKVDTGLSRVSRGLDDLSIGERVLVAGQRKGVIQYCGDTEFAPGLWYGIELDRPVGKNDGSVNGTRYFTCRPKYGVFAPPTRLQRLSDIHGSRESLDSISAAQADRHRRLSISSSGSQQSLQSQASKKAALSRPKSSGTHGLRRSFSNVGSEFKLTEGMSVFCNNELGVVRYIGPVEFAEGVWLGVELRTPKGKNDGSVQGKRYFSCRPGYGLVVRPSKVTVRGINGAKLLGDTASHPTSSSPSQLNQSAVS